MVGRWASLWAVVALLGGCTTARTAVPAPEPSTPAAAATPVGPVAAEVVGPPPPLQTVALPDPRDVAGRFVDAAVPPWVGATTAPGPQLDRAGELYLASPDDGPEVEAVDGGLVVCRVRVSEGFRFDWFRAPDVVVTLSIGRTPAVTRWGPANTAMATPTVPGVQLTRGELVQVRVEDQDVTERELIGTAKKRFQGRFPLTLVSRYSTTRCRLAPPELAQEWTDARLQESDSLLAALEGVEGTRAFTRDWGRPGGRVREAREALHAAAALAGWKDPRVRERTRRLIEWEARWRMAAEAHLELLSRELPERGMEVEVGREVVLRVMQVEWRTLPGDRSWSAMVRIEVENRRDEPLKLRPSGAPLGLLNPVHLVLSSGRTIALEPRLDLAEGEERPTEVAPGGTLTVLLRRTRADLLPEEGTVHPRLLWAGAKDRLFALDDPDL